jgi:hypothetical protein
MALCLPLLNVVPVCVCVCVCVCARVREICHTPAELVFIYKLIFMNVLYFSCKNEFGIILIYCNICNC